MNLSDIGEFLSIVTIFYMTNYPLFSKKFWILFVAVLVLALCSRFIGRNSK